VNKLLTVSEINNLLKETVEGSRIFSTINLTGEISDFKLHASGVYFTLKDSASQIRCTCFLRNIKAKFNEFKSGDKVNLKGSISFYVPRGEYSFNVSEIEKAGVGDLLKQLELLKKTYQELGYFDQAHKKAIPKFPRVIGVVTAETGAVIHDIMTTINNRYRLCEVILYPTLVQGEKAANAIAEKINKANLDNVCDVLIVGRGGGSFEDLFAFNQPNVVEAIFNSRIPIITAIGHDTDVTLSDFVADFYTSTPTGAATIAVPNMNDLLNQINNYQNQIDKTINYFFDNYQAKIDKYTKLLNGHSPINKIAKLRQNIQICYLSLQSLWQKNCQVKNLAISQLQMKLLNFNPQNKLTRTQNALSNLTSNLILSFQNYLESKKTIIEKYQNKIALINPFYILNKGYAVIKQNNQIITSIKSFNPNIETNIVMYDGEITINKKGS